jgi:hypothetical protein
MIDNLDFRFYSRFSKNPESPGIMGSFLMKIRSFRLTYIWVEAMPELFDAKPSGKMTKCLAFSEYKDAFDDATSGSGRYIFDAPWPRSKKKALPEGNNFWNATLFKEFRDKQGVDRAELAWKAAIPFRRKTSMGNIKHDGRCFFEGWYFPLGVVVTLTAWISGSYDRDQMVAEIGRFQRDRHTITWDDGAVGTEELDDLARRALDRMRHEAFDLLPGKYDPERYAILTTISADRAAGDENEVEACLAALRSAMGDRGRDAPELGDIYLSSHARIIWRPDRFDSALAGSHTLGCLHRNVTVATLYGAALIRFAEIMVAAFIDEANQVPPKFEPYARIVAGLLGRIYGATKYTYKLPALRIQIGNAKPVIDRLRQRLDMTALQ